MISADVRKMYNVKEGRHKCMRVYNFDGIDELPNSLNLKLGVVTVKGEMKTTV